MSFREEKTKIERLFEVACLDLLESLNYNAVRIELDNYAIKNGLSGLTTATISASSFELELQARLQLSESVLTSTYPLQGEINANELNDWVLELSNQLMGRLKSKLMLHNCQVSLGLPKVFNGVESDVLIVDESVFQPISFMVEGEACTFHLSIKVLGDELLFSMEADDSIDLLDEGEMELF